MHTYKCTYECDDNDDNDEEDGVDDDRLSEKGQIQTHRRPRLLQTLTGR